MNSNFATYIVAFEGDRTPPVSADTTILGGRLISVAFSDIRPRWHSLTENWPSAGETVLFYTRCGDTVIGYVDRQGDIIDARVGGVLDTDYDEITHWCRIPDAPEPSTEIAEAD